MRVKRENGVALITVLLILFLVSALVVGMSWMVMSDQRLGGNNSSRETAFYGAEAGMEKMTSDMGNIFTANGAIGGPDIVTITGAPPNNIPGVTYANTLGSTYKIGCPLFPCVAPVGASDTLRPPSPYWGMQALVTPFTLSVAAQTQNGAEVKLQRQVQLVSIPVFQFGIFSNTDLAFFNGPPFDFGGRIHTNGNLWLAANAGPLYVRNNVTVVGQVIRTNLENGFPIAAGGNYSGVVTIALAPLPPIPPNYPPAGGTNAQWRALGLGEGSMLGPNTYGALSGLPNNTAPTFVWNTTVNAYQGMLKNGVQPLNLIATALGGLATPVALIHRPSQGEQGTNLAQFNQRYFSETQASLRIMLDDYGPGGLPGVPGACNASPMMVLDTVSAGTPPIDLATLAYTGAPPAGIAWYTGKPNTYPLPLSNAAAVAYSPYNTGAPAPTGPLDGYWQAKGQPTITGCIKIEYVPVGGAAGVDVTQEILQLGLTGRNINPQSKNPNGAAGATNELLFLPDTGTVAGAETATCGAATDLGEPSPNAVIRIARVRDNPSTAYGVPSAPCTPTASGYDYWPMVLYDPREGVVRDNALANNAADNLAAPAPGVTNRPQITAEGVMNYVELDVNNLSRWFTKAIGASGNLANFGGGYEVYFSDRRGNEVDPTAGINAQMGSFGFNDVVNESRPADGCSDQILDNPGEDFEGDGVLRTYGGYPLSAAFPAGPTSPQIQGLIAGGPTLPLVLKPNALCATAPAPPTAPAPNFVYTHNEEARENPPVFFRRALKIEYGVSINLGTICFGAAPNPPCGLTIASENPVYIQGDYNNTGAPINFTGANVAASVAADSVTLLSDNWNDVNSFISPYDPGSRPGTQTTYRVAIIAGKGIPFAQPAGSGQDYGTDGGVHNFLRYLEGWGAGLYYQGSLVNFYYSRQANGTYKCCNTVYGPPTRFYTFDTTFTNGPQWLPPRTPTLRSVNTIGFTQMMNPNE